MSTIEAKPADVVSQPHLDHEVHQIQKFDELRKMPIGLDADVRSATSAGLNQVLADTRILHDLYKKAHWNMRGHTFYQLHLLMDTHAEQQDKLIDSLAERIQTLGAIAVGDARHVAEITSIPRPPDGAETVPNMLTRILDAHERIIVKAREVAELADDKGDTTTDDLLTSEVVPVNELQVWFVIEHLVDVPVVD